MCERGCATCPFKGIKIGPKGNPEAKFVIVGESPGAHELAKGMPFMGPSGKLLEQLIPAEIETFTTNAISCLPRGKDEKVLATCVDHCRDRLLAEVTAHPRDMILALGNAAVWALTGKNTSKITQIRGTLIKSEYAKVGIMPTLHPAFVLRGGSFKKFKDDIQYAVDLYKGESTKQYIEPDYINVTEENVDEIVAKIKAASFAASDIETTGFDRRRDGILCIGFCISPEMVYMVDTRNGFALLNRFLPLLADPNIKWAWHNGKFDVSFLRAKGIDSRVDEDTMLLSYALDETRGIHDLDQVAADTLAAPNHKQALKPYLEGKVYDEANPKGRKKHYGDIPKDVLDKYAAYDVSKTFQIWHVLRALVAKDHHLEKLYTKTLIPGSEMLTCVELNGNTFDWDWWQSNKDRLETEIVSLRAEINNIAGYDVNPNSSKQMIKLLYTEMGIKTKTLSTGKAVIAKLPRLPIIVALTKYRKATKAYSTYVKGLAKTVNPDTNTVHATYKIQGTPTGRLACSEPNMQNIPREALLRGMFVARPGYILLDADLSQAELRSLAAFSRDPALCDIYLSTNRSLHKEVATEMYGPDYDGDQLIRAKAVNFGIVYGREAYSIAEEFSISVTEAQRIIDVWFARFPVAKQFIDRCRDAPVARRTLITPFGRKKRPGVIQQENIKQAQNEFSNFPHQSVASDINLHAAVILNKVLHKYDARIINLVHDSIIIEVPNRQDYVDEVSELAMSTMQQVPLDWGIDTVPFKSECKLCYHWGNEIKLLENPLNV